MPKKLADCLKVCSIVYHMSGHGVSKNVRALLVDLRHCADVFPHDAIYSFGAHLFSPSTDKHRAGVARGARYERTAHFEVGSESLLSRTSEGDNSMLAPLPHHFNGHSRKINVGRAEFNQLAEPYACAVQEFEHCRIARSFRSAAIRLVHQPMHRRLVEKTRQAAFEPRRGNGSGRAYPDTVGSPEILEERAKAGQRSCNAPARVALFQQ